MASSTPGEVKRMSTTSPGLGGLKALTDMLTQHLQRMKEQDSLVEAAIDNVVDKENQALLRRAKQRALDDERELLNSLQVLELGDFLRATVLVQKMYDEMYAPHKKEQEKARSVYAPDMEEFEKKPKPLTEGSNIVSLMFGAQHLYLPAFEKFMSQTMSEFKKQKIKILKHSKVSCKSIERTFYKTYYVYVGDHKQMTDLMRCSFVFDNFVDLYRAFSIMKKLANENTSIKGGILRAKDRFNPPEIPFGYRDLLVNLNCPGTSLVCEVQFHHEIFYKFKKDSHYVYKRARLFELADRNMAYEYVTEHIKPKIGKNEHYVPRNFGKEEGSDDEEGMDGKKTTKGEKEEVKETCQELLQKWLPDKTKKSPDGIIQVDVDGTPMSYLQILEQDGFDSVDSWEDLNEDDLKGMNFKTGHIRTFLKQKNEYFDGFKKRKENKQMAIENEEKARQQLLEKDLMSKEEGKKREEMRIQREAEQKLELERLKFEQEKLLLEKEKRAKDEEYRRLEAERQQQLELEKLRLETERLKTQKASSNNNRSEEKQDFLVANSDGEVVVKCSDVHFYGQMNDQKELLVKEAVKCNSTVESITISCQWKDQGWGNQKSKVFLRIADANGKEKQDYDLFGIAPHGWQIATKTFSGNSEVLQNIARGDILRFARYVGGGGGHEMFINGFNAVVKFKPVGEVKTMEFRTVHYVGEYNDQKQLLVRDSIKCGANVSFIAINCEWKDQGWGNQKGCVYVRVTSPSGDVQDYDCFGIAPHSWESVSKEFNESNATWVSEIKPGALIQIARYVGGGGGHELFIDNFKATVTFHAKSQTLPDKDGEVKATQNFHLVGPLIDKAQLLFDEGIKCPCRVKSVDITCQWKNQGFGDRKGMLYLVVIKRDGSKKFYDVSRDPAPHNWATLNVSFPKNHGAIQSIDEGDTIQFGRLVGDGGGHELFINEFKATVKWG